MSAKKVIAYFGVSGFVVAVLVLCYYKFISKYLAGSTGGLILFPAMPLLMYSEGYNILTGSLIALVAFSANAIIYMVVGTVVWFALRILRG